MKNLISLNNFLVIIFFILAFITAMPPSTVFNDKYKIIVMAFNMFLLIICFLKNKINIFFSKKVNLIVFISLIIFVIYPIFNTNIVYYSQATYNYVLNILFIINAFLISLYLNYKNNKERYFFMTYCLIAAALIFMYFYNFDNFEGVKQIKSVFDNKLRYRNSYGFVHPNTTGYFCYLALILQFYLSKFCFRDYNNMKKGFAILNIIVVIILVSSASRTAITALILFYVLFYFFIINNKFKDKGYIGVTLKAVKIMLAIIFTVLIIYKIKTLDLISLLNDTNRMNNFINGISTVYSYGKEITGLGFVDEINDFYYGIIYIDNWFLYMFITEGFVGLTVSLVLIGLIFYYIIRISDKSFEKFFVLSFLISQIYYSMFETMFFYQAYLPSFILWIFNFNYISNYNKLVKLDLDTNIN